MTPGWRSSSASGRERTRSRRAATTSCAPPRASWARMRGATTSTPIRTRARCSATTCIRCRARSPRASAPRRCSRPGTPRSTWRRSTTCGSARRCATAATSTRPAKCCRSMAASGSSTNPMSFPASEIDVSARPGSVAELVAAGSIEISPRELHRAAEVAALVPAGTCAYVPSLPGHPVSRVLEAVAVSRQAGRDPLPHQGARRSAVREPLREFLRRAAGEHGVHRVLLVGGDQPSASGPYSDTLQVLEEGVLADTGIREIGIAGYPEGHPRIAPAALEEAFARKRRLAAEQGLGVYVVTQFCFAPARVVDLKIANVSGAGCQCVPAVDQTVFDNALNKRDFSPPSTRRGYANGHTHINLPPLPRFIQYPPVNP